MFVSMLVMSCVPDMGTGIPAPVEVARIEITERVSALLAKDIDGDGMDEIMFAQPSVGSYPDFEAGAVYLLTGPVQFNGGLQSNSFTQSGGSLELRGQTAFKHYGGSLAAADLNDDGCSDVVISSDIGLDGMASVVVVSGRLRGVQPLETSAFLTLIGPPTLGQALAAMDYNGDGIEDLIVSCPVRSQVYVVLGPRAGYLNLPDDADAILEGGNGALGWTISAGRFGTGGAMQLAVAEPVRDAVYIVPSGSLGRHDVTEIATAEIRSSNAIDNIIGCEGTTGPADVGDRLVVRVRRTDSEQSGTVFVLTPPITGNLDLREDADLILEPVHIGRTMSPAIGVLPTSPEPVLALGFPDQTQLPESSLTGQLWVIPADLQGTRELNQAELGRYWDIRAQDAGVDLFGIIVRFGALTRPGASDLMVASNNAIVVYSWDAP